MLPVAVEIAPPTAPREHVVALMAACSRAVADAQCVPAAEVAQTETQAVAIVTWRGDESARVEVGLRAQGKPVWRSRNLTFNAADAVVERWRAVGYVVGTLARDERPPDEPVVAEPEPEPKPPVVPPAAPKPAPPPHDSAAKNAPAPATGPARATIDVGAVVGPAFSGLRSGGVVRTRWPLQEPLRLFVSARYLERAADENGLSGRWLTFGAGLGLVLGSEQFEASANINLRGEYFQARAEDRYGRSQSDGRPLPGLGLGVSGAFMPIPMLGVYLGGDAAVMFSYTTIVVASQPPVVDQALRFAADAGVRLKLW